MPFTNKRIDKSKHFTVIKWFILFKKLSMGPKVEIRTDDTVKVDAIYSTFWEFGVLLHSKFIKIS